MVDKWLKIVLVFLIITVLGVGGYLYFKTAKKTTVTENKNSNIEESSNAIPNKIESLAGVMKCYPTDTGCQYNLVADDGTEYKLIDFAVEVEDGARYEMTGFKGGISEDGYREFMPNSYAKI